MSWKLVKLGLGVRGRSRSRARVRMRRSIGLVGARVRGKG